MEWHTFLNTLFSHSSIERSVISTYFQTSYLGSIFFLRDWSSVKSVVSLVTTWRQLAYKVIFSYNPWNSSNIYKESLIWEWYILWWQLTESLFLHHLGSKSRERKNHCKIFKKHNMCQRYSELEVIWYHIYQMQSPIKNNFRFSATCLTLLVVCSRDLFTCQHDQKSI